MRFLAVTVLISTLLATGCNPKDAPAPAPTTPKLSAVKLALNWVPEPEFGGFYAARESGAYEAQGLAVEILQGAAGLPTVQMVATGQVDFAIVSGDEVVISRARGGDVVAIFATYQDNPQGIMTHASRGLTSLADAFSHPGTVLLEPGAPYARWLEKKIGFATVTIAPYSGGVTQFLADSNVAQQCFVTSEPVAARRQGAEPKTFLVAESGYNPYAAVVAVSGKTLRERPEVVKGFMKATRTGWRAYLDDPASANAVMGKLNAAMDAQTFMDVAAAQAPLIETEWTKAQGLGSMSLERWALLAGQLVELEILDVAPPAQEYFASIQE